MGTSFCPAVPHGGRYSSPDHGLRGRRDARGRQAGLQNRHRGFRGADSSGGSMDMVTNVTNLSRSGLYDWMAQRVSAVVLAAYFIFLIGYMVFHPGLSYAQWHDLFAHNGMRIFSLLALVALGAHAWVGMWTIATDYLTPMALGKSATAVRFLFQAVCGVLMFAYFVWGVQILWGI
ncbi:succinate dehydrogenase, hydrophobic membrane anchor protein [Pseudomonas coronafaciens pv. porri]|nr:succinate dehydrogenase, hydrophobic membrane anchor protein [Pseudomonas coronafaciens pv. garcae]RMT58615.1 succinate dehydrogenase, hydrophobic membrane anchor protein [Pseudomonas coronafaciens pv. atropurpurea]RMW13534.1 succinate dehydrogenase, hydrophobic membrane anchor protein [Pseudomonas coronafaciens pv. porri]